MVFRAKKIDFQPQFKKIKSSILKAVGYKEQESLTIRQLHQSEPGVILVGTLEQESESMENVKGKLSEVKELAGF